MRGGGAAADCSAVRPPQRAAKFVEYPNFDFSIFVKYPNFKHFFKFSLNFSDEPAENYLMEGLKILRKRKNLTQKEVADAVGITFQTYSYYETGRTKPTPEMLCKLADFFGVTVDELLGRTPQLFDDARVQKSDEQALFDELTAEEKQMVVGYMKGLIFNRTKGRKAQ